MIHNFLASEIRVSSECKIWDIATYPNDVNSIVVILAGFGSKEQARSHVWRGIIPKSNSSPTEWTDISPRSDRGEIIDIPVNAVIIDDQKPETMYIGTDIGVFRTTDSGGSWTKFSEGLPNCAVFDMRLYTDSVYEDQKPKQLLRVVTHGRGMWERRLDVDTMPKVDIFVRDHLMDTGRFTPSRTSLNAAFDDPLQHEDPNRGIALDSELNWSMCADIKVDSPLPYYQFGDIESVDYVKFESKLIHRNIRRERVNHIYVQVHNRGIMSAGQDPRDKVQIKLLYANIINTDSEYPKLPSNLWSGFLDNSFDTSVWKPIGEVKYLPSGSKTLTNIEPTTIGWKWNVPLETADRICLLVIINSPEDPIRDKNKEIVNIENLVRIEKHIGLRQVQVVDT
jgi:hypothetical protein